MEPFLAQIVMFGGNFAPRGWAFCNGQLLPISSYPALFSLLGTVYGGDGRTTFALPDFRGRAPIHAGSGPGLDTVRPGQKMGQNDVVLTTNQIPPHNHRMEISQTAPSDNRGAAELIGRAQIFTDDTTSVMSLNSKSISNTGGGMAHSNMQPSVGTYYIIALEGLFPSRS